MRSFFLAEVSAVTLTDGDGLPAAARMVPCGEGELVTAPLAVGLALRAGMGADPSGLFWCLCAPDGSGLVCCREDGGL